MEYCNDLVSVVIATFNQRDYIKDCICSLTSQNYPYLEIIIINNGRKEDLESLGVEFPFLKIINNEENFFFSRAQNQGIDASNR
jgi:GT2 family glycosyltransferase